MKENADRPAAEMLAEIVGLFAEDRRRGRQLSVWADSYVYALRRLVRAEQALAEAQADAWDEGVGWVVDMYDASAYLANNPYRASQGGQDLATNTPEDAAKHQHMYGEKEEPDPWGGP